MKKVPKFKIGETLKYDIGPKLNRIVDLVNRDIKGDGKTITVNEFGNVISIKTINKSGGAPGGSDTYKGYFKVIQTAANKIKIIDGFNIDNANCGQVSVNKLALAPVTATELTITADAFIYLECVGIGDPLTSSTNTIEQYEEEQSWEAGKEKILISRVLATAPVAPATKATITNFSIEPVPSRIGIKGACD